MEKTVKAHIPAALVSGGLKARHVFVLHIACVFVGVAVAFKFGRTVDPDIRNLFVRAVGPALGAALMFLVALVIPEMRRALPVLYGTPRERMSAGDAALFLAVMLTWGLGLNMLLINIPIVLLDPSLFRTMGFRTQPMTLQYTTGLFVLIATTIVAPFVEELIFRGFLQNLWMNRFGLWAGIVLSAIAFGAIHNQSAGFAAVAGIFLSLVYLRFGSLWPGMLLHSFYNLLVFPSTPWLNFFLVKNRNDFSDPSSWWMQIAAAAMFLPLLLIFWRRFRPSF